MSRPDARWRTVCKLYQTADMVTYEEAAEALGLDADRDRKVIQNAFRRAGEELLDTAGRVERFRRKYAKSDAGKAEAAKK